MGDLERAVAQPAQRPDQRPRHQDDDQQRQQDRADRRSPRRGSRAVRCVAGLPSTAAVTELVVSSMILSRDLVGGLHATPAGPGC